MVLQFCLTRTDNKIIDESDYTIASGKSMEHKIIIPIGIYTSKKTGKIRILSGNLLMKEWLLNVDTAKDIEGHWAEEILKTYLLKDFATNKEEEEFKPNDRITRAEFAAILSKALSLKDLDISKSFSDMETSHDYFKEVMFAAKNGLINGYPDTTFKPDNEILRQDAAMIMNNVCKLRNIKLANEGLIEGYSDKADISAYANQAVDMCITNKIITGKPGMRVDPKANLTRAEAVVIIDRLLTALNKEDV